MALVNGSILAGLGVGLSAATGTVWRIAPQTSVPAKVKSTKGARVEAEALKAAIAKVSAELDSLGQNSGATNAEILEALKFLLEDEELFEVSQAHLAEGWSAGAAFAMAVDEFAELLGNSSPTVAERAADLQDLSKRVQFNLSGIKDSLDLPAIGPLILVGEDFSPAETAQFTSAVVGVITTGGGPTSHASIICRSRGIPAVVSCAGAESLENGDLVLVDPVGNRVIVGADASLATPPMRFLAVSDEPIIAVRCNIGTRLDAQAAAKTSGAGVGLFRTEMLYLNQQTKPSTQQQTATYIEVFEAAPAGPIVVRTLDSGRDKPVPFLTLAPAETQSHEAEGYRLLSEHRGFIKEQLESLEAARKETGREVWVMAPMIATVDEAADFCALARSIGKFKVGIMVETLSIAALIGQLKGIVDFVSIGTNDLSHYLLAADRINPTPGTSTSHWEPLLIRTLEQIATDGKAAQIEVGVCGESASDPVFAVVLAGLGVSSVSVSPSQVDLVRAALSSVDADQAKKIAKAALAATSPAAAEAAALGHLLSA